jgi:ribosomal protein S18 acetylase RimI-like enzyme
MTPFATETSQAAVGLTSLFLSPARFITRREENRKGRMKEIFQIRSAQMSDMRAIIGLIDEAAVWLNAAKGTDQWQRPWPDLAARDQRIRRGIKVGRTWIVENPSQPADSPRRLVGTVSCGRGGNKKLWTLRERNEPAVYISRLIVRREYAGHEVGAALINWVGVRGISNWGAEWIRVDVWTTNQGLQAYYKAQKFAHVRTYDFDDYWEYPSAALFQKPAAEIDAADAELFQEVS